MRVSMQASAVRAKKNLTQRSRSTQRTQRRRLTEEILGGGADDAGSRLGRGLVAIATNENNGRAFRLAHQEASSSSELIGDGEDRRGERLSLAIPGASQIEKHGNAGRANGDICQAEAPGAAKGVADDDGEAFAGSLAERGDKLFGGTIGIAGEQSHDAAATNIRMVNPGIGADETVVSFRNQDVLAAHDAPRFLQNDFNDARVLLQPMGNGNRLNRRFYLCKPDHRSFGLGNDLLSDDKNVAIFEVHPSFPRRIRYSFGKVISPANFREPRDAKQPQAGSGRRSVLRGRGGFRRSGHERGRGILREPGKAFTCREVSREKRTGGAPELSKRAARDDSLEPLSPFSGAVCRLFPCPSVYPTACLLDVPAASVVVVAVVVFSAASAVPGRVCSPVDRAAAVVFAGLAAAADPACAASVPAAAVVSAGPAAGCGRPQFSAEFSAVPAAVARSAAAPDLASGGAVPDPAELSAAPGLAFARSAAVPGPVSGGAARFPADASVRAAGSHFQAHCQDCLAAPKADGRCRFSDCRRSRANCPACCQVC